MELGALIRNKKYERHYELMERLVAELPPGAGRLEFTDARPQVDFAISVAPKNPSAARIELAFLEKFAYLSLGEATTIEIPPSGGVNLNAGQLDQIEIFARAVMQGKLEESRLC